MDHLITSSFAVRTKIVNGSELWSGFTCHQHNFNICSGCMNDQFFKIGEFGHVREHSESEHGSFQPVQWTFYWTRINTTIKTVYQPTNTSATQARPSTGTIEDGRDVMLDIIMTSGGRPDLLF